MFKKGQAAMEFLMTYGWAILVVLAAIGALAFFGVLDTTNLLPERCAFPAGMDCIGRAAVDASADTVTFVLQNNNGAQITLSSGTVTTTDCTNTTVAFCAGTGCVANATNVVIANNQKATVGITCTGLAVGRFSADVRIDYIDSTTGLTLPASGQIRGKAS